MTNVSRIAKFVDQNWEELLPSLCDYIAIPAKSPSFDPQWEERGEIDRAIGLIYDWCKDQALENWEVRVVRLEGRTPLIWIEIPGTGDAKVLLYGHLDKQPEMTGWSAGLGPWKPVFSADRLYGRGAADDGYAVFASVTALKALHAEGISHSPCSILIEACEESGSYDLPFYIEHLSQFIGEPDLVICLDSGCGNYEQLWCTTSLRGLVSGTLTVEVLEEGVHSGDAGGIVPSSFRLSRGAISRLENEATGEILLPEFKDEIPPDRTSQAEISGGIIGRGVYNRFPFVTPRAENESAAELILNRTWRSALEVTGASGLPPLEEAGNVLRPKTTLKLSIRTPPRVDPEKAALALKRSLESTQEPGTKIGFSTEMLASGWNSPSLSPWLEKALERVSISWFERPAVLMGEGGTIPFMGMLGKRYPRAQFVITGVLGPGSNAHGPNEFLHIPTAKKLTGCIAEILKIHLNAVSGDCDPTSS